MKKRGLSHYVIKKYIPSIVFDMAAAGTHSGCLVHQTDKGGGINRPERHCNVYINWHSGHWAP